LMASAAAGSAGERKLSLFFDFGFRRQPAVGQPGTSCKSWLDCSRAPDGITRQCRFNYYQNVRQHKLPLLREAARNFLESAPGNAQARFERFCADNDWWLEDFVLFDALRDRHNGAPWNQWPRELACREPEALEAVRSALAPELALRRVIQFAFWEQWHALRFYCAQHSIRVVGDIAIFVAYNSVDVWTHRDLFRLKENLEPEVVSGVPPDAFSANGQRWGNPLYDWNAMR